MTATTLILIGILSQTARPGAQPPRPGAAPESQATPTATIKGRITAADTGRPLRRARVTLFSPPADTRSTSTNVRGEYEFRNIPAGRYDMNVQRSGYLTAAYGQRRYAEPGKPLQVEAGAQLEKVDVALTRAGVVSGRLIDEAGEPVPGVRVWAMRREYFRARRQLVPVGGDNLTDDVGRFRLPNIPPGEYFVMASARETWVSGKDKQVYSYAPTFFPGTASTTDATRVKVAVGQETPDVDFALVAARAAMLSGTAVRADGSPLAGGRVSLNLEVIGSTGGISMGVSSASVAADGTWQIVDVPPGEYRLSATLQPRNGLPERSTTTINVQGADVHGLTLTTDSGGTLTGQVVTDDGAALPPAPSGPLRVRSESVSDGTVLFGAQFGADNGVVGSDGRFTLRGVLGPSVIRVPNLPRGWVVQSIEADDRDFASAPVEVRGGAALDVRIVVTNKFPAVSGRITDDKGTPVEGVVLLVPADASRWFDPTVLRSSRPDQSGIFQIDSVRPGDYFAIALDSVQSWQTRDPEFLETLRKGATSVTVREGEPEQLNLRVVR